MQTEGDTLYTELPPPKSPWALGILLVVLVVFGTFWFIESERAEQPGQVVEVAPTAGIDTLTASVENISIPSYSDTF